MLKKILSLTFYLDRPQGFKETVDKYLPKIIQEISNLIRAKQKDFIHETFRLSASQINNLAQVLVEFAEDIHNSIGIWEAMERYNLELFGTRLPLILEPGTEMPPGAFNTPRVQYLLFIYSRLLHQQLIASPHHRDLIFLASAITEFLEAKFQTMPQASGVKTFLATPNDYGWDVKKKLIWLGKHSYLFRQCFQNYAKDHDGSKDVPTIDDFLNQETTIWSGLGVIDILAAILDISQEDRVNIRSWHERHCAFYKVISTPGPVIEMLNIINNQPYTVRVGDSSNNFDEQHLYFGNLVPYKGEWYWSGAQQRYDMVSEAKLKKVKADFLSSTKTMVFRYCKDLADKARESTKDQYLQFKKYANGEDYLVFPDGRAFTDSMQEQLSIIHEDRLAKLEASPAEKEKFKVPDFSKSLPKEILKSANGCCMYFNPDEGMEIWIDFNCLLGGLKKKGIDLDDDELYAISGLIFSDSISPNFVRELVRRFGEASIRAAFFLREPIGDQYCLEYLLRQNKGQYFRNRYPSISFVESTH